MMQHAQLAQARYEPEELLDARVRRAVFGCNNSKLLNVRVDVSSRLQLQYMSIALVEVCTINCLSFA